ncbi:MAG TPA: 2Fe-2S iron-sulfur cluster-binding protein [Kribbella sp.]|jgi:CDP-4-dehydro-6-deoxyglucose reductase/3-phenylpropionate/trans-cinnamate dioxygenase ferredoxin reductase subunit
MNLDVRVADTDIVFDCTPEETVLEAAERAGYALPYSCRKGVCNSCEGALTEGAVNQRGTGELCAPADNVKLCLATPSESVEIKPTRIARRDPPARRTMTTTVHRISAAAQDVTVVALRYPIGKRVKFRAGQYAIVQLPDGDTRNYSLANSPQRNDSAVLHVRRVVGGKFSDHMLGGLRLGDRLTVRLPFGEFTVDHKSDRPILLLVTGTGFAPARSIIEDLIKRGAHRPVHLFWGGRQVEDLYQAELAARWARRHDWLRFTPVLSCPAPDWTGRTGYVQHAALSEHPDLGEYEVYACGSPAMTEAARTELEIDPDHFHSDAFLPSSS